MEQCLAKEIEALGIKVGHLSSSSVSPLSFHSYFQFFFFLIHLLFAEMGAVDGARTSIGGGMWRTAHSRDADQAKGETRELFCFPHFLFHFLHSPLAPASQKHTTYVGVNAGMHNLLRPALYGSHHAIVNLSRAHVPGRRYVVINVRAITTEIRVLVLHFLI